MDPVRDDHFLMGALGRGRIDVGDDWYEVKSTPSYSLVEILAQMQSVPDMNLTVSARSGIRFAGMSQVDALVTLQALTRRHFYKSMTTHADHKIWQDVYLGQWGDVSVYIKFQRAGEYFVVSFKEL